MALLTTEQMQALQQSIAAVEAENARLRAQIEARRPKKTLKVSPKGALSVYGMGRWPVTLYKQQWLSLLDMGQEIRTFIHANAHLLADKEE